MAKLTKKENALNLFSEVPQVNISKDTRAKKKTETEKEIESPVVEESAVPTNIAKKVQQQIKKSNPKKGKISGYVEADLLDEFKELCKKRNLKLSDVLEQLIKIYVDG